jgi:hypothetical protein
MSAYIPLIKTTRWIDLSTDHKKLRNELEQDTLKACVSKDQMQPFMLQGAFGIGKTNSLYYLFHYGWCKLKTPTFFVSLDELIKSVKDFALSQPTGKIQNDQLGPFINEILTNQINTLKEEDWANLERLFFPEFNGGNLNNYLEGFRQVVVIEDSKKHIRFDETFSEAVIQEAINSSNRPLLLIDEFETKFYEFKKYIEASGGGLLKKLFDQIVEDTSLFYLIIGNGPASGYEIAKERGDDSSDSETAANRRLKTKQIPFPTSNLLQRSFLKGDPKGYINFIWWLSRCRPGHILKLRDSLGAIEDLKLLTNSELITKSIFREPIDEGGEAVTYLKTQFFNDVNGRIQAAILGKVLTEFQPIEFDVKDFKQDLRDCVPFFLCSSATINTEIDLIAVLRDDFYSIHLKNYQQEGKFDSVNYIEHIHPYFTYILNGISDSDGNISFGMINDSKPDEIIATTFLTPLLELTYDFISLYQDDTIKETRESLDFLLHLINSINKSTIEGNLELFVPNTFDRFEKCKLLRNDKVYLQLSLFAIRESIEQPIGSPNLKYKNEQVSELINKITKKEDLPLIFYKEDNLYIYFIPALDDELLEKYLENLQKHLYDLFYNKFHQDGQTVIRIIYFELNERIDEFRKDLLNKNGDINQPEPIYSLSKIDVVELESYQLNFGGQIRDYIDSVSQIMLIGYSKGESSILSLKKDDNTINLKEVLKVIGDRPWTEKKETIRTIEHYRKLLFDGDNSTFKSILNIANKEYKDKLDEAVCNAAEYKSNVYDHIYLNKLIKDESESYDLFTSDLALMYLFENITIEDSIKQLLELCKSEYRFDFDKEDATKGINFKNLLSILTKNKKELEIHTINFDLNSSFISKLSILAKTLLNEEEIKTIDEYFSYLKNRQEKSFIKSYHNSLGGFLLPELTDTLYNLNYLSRLSISDAIGSITKDLNGLEASLSEVRVKIVSKLDELKTILDEGQSLSSYPEKLNKAIKGIVLIKTILDKEPSRSTLLIISSVIKHLSKIVIDSKTFFEQLDEIYNDIAEQKKKVDTIQDEIDTLYGDPLTEKLLGFDYPEKRINDYLWKKNYLRHNLKNKDEYEKLFGNNKNTYDPYSRPTIYPDKIESFYKCLITISNKLNPVFDEMVLKMREVKKTAESTTQIQNYINQLLTPIEE